MKTENLYYLLLTYQKVAPHAFPYLTMMALRIIELHRVLKQTGSFYLHCDPTMSHYLKTACDIVFGGDKYRNEIVWKRTSAHNDPKRYGSNIDIISITRRGLNGSGTRGSPCMMNPDIKRYKNKDEDGRLWTDGDLSAKGLSGGGYVHIQRSKISLACSS